MLIAEDLTLLLLDDAEGTWLLDGAQRGPALAGAVLTELVLLGRVAPADGDPDRDDDEPDPRRVGLVVVDASPTGDPVLDEALRRAGGRRPSRADDLLSRLSTGLEDELVGRLVAAGALERREERVWRIFARTTHPSADPGAERSVRDRVHAALRGGRADDRRTAALVALLGVSGVLPEVVDGGAVGMDRRQLQDAGRAVAADDRTAGAVGRALEAVDAAVLVAVVVPAMTSATRF